MTEQDSTSVWRAVQGAAVLVVLGFFLYATRDVLNPLLLFALLWAVLLPFRERPGHLALVTVAATVTVFWLLASTGSLLAPFILAIVLAYVLDPLVDRLERRWLSRNMAMAALSVVTVGLLAVAILLVVPAAIRQLGQIAQDVPVLVERLVVWLQEARTRGVGQNLPLVSELLARLQTVDADAIVELLQGWRDSVASGVWSGVLGLGRGVRSAFTIVGYVALTPILTFYLLRDWDGILGVLARLIPTDHRPGFVRFLGECDKMISRYLRGQVTVALMLGAITWAGLAIAGFPNAGLLALIVAVFNIVPYLGLVLSLIPAVFLALVSGSVGLSLLKVTIVYGGAQLLEGAVISPRIVGDSVGLHPVTVLLALSLGSFFFGFVGLLIGVPLAAVGKLLLVQGIARYEDSAFYRGRAASAAGDG